MAGSHAPRPKKNRDTLHNEAWLRQKYLEERLATTDIAALLGCSAPTVRWALDKFSIPRRAMSEAKTGRPSTTVWTAEMREALAAQRRGAVNPFHGRVSPHRGPNYDPDPRMAKVRYTRAHRKGVNGEQYDAMLAAQGGVCAICKRPERKISASGSPFTLAVDHCHKSGKVRALLCNACNACLGMTAENIDTLRAMVVYLENHALDC